ncbi:hypothetical protein SAMD00079811_00010 [Scytonema sp. HK-05]|nr:hypothetical protein SAMD00079811_00010 [Scytonema sp. HK-05]
MLMLPPLPTPVNPTVLRMPTLLTSSTEFVARTDTLPAFPCPKVLALSLPPSLKDKEPEEIVMFPPLPTAPVSTELKIALAGLSLTPAIVTGPVTSTVTLPASPLPGGWSEDASRTAVAS